MIKITAEEYNKIKLTNFLKVEYARRNLRINFSEIVNEKNILESPVVKCFLIKSKWINERPIKDSFLGFCKEFSFEHFVVFARKIMILWDEFISEHINDKVNDKELIKRYFNRLTIQKWFLAVYLDIDYFPQNLNKYYGVIHSFFIEEEIYYFNILCCFISEDYIFDAYLLTSDFYFNNARNIVLEKQNLEKNFIYYSDIVRLNNKTKCNFPFGVFEFYYYDNFFNLNLQSIDGNLLIFGQVLHESFDLEKICIEIPFQLTFYLYHYYNRTSQAIREGDKNFAKLIKNDFTDSYGEGYIENRIIGLMLWDKVTFDKSSFKNAIDTELKNFELYKNIKADSAEYKVLHNFYRNADKCIRENVIFPLAEKKEFHDKSKNEISFNNSQLYDQYITLSVEYVKRKFKHEYFLNFDYEEETLFEFDLSAVKQIITNRNESLKTSNIIQDEKISYNRFLLYIRQFDTFEKVLGLVTELIDYIKNNSAWYIKKEWSLEENCVYWYYAFVDLFIRNMGNYPEQFITFFSEELFYKFILLFYISEHYGFNVFVLLDKISIQKILTNYAEYEMYINYNTTKLNNDLKYYDFYYVPDTKQITFSEYPYGNLINVENFDKKVDFYSIIRIEHKDFNLDKLCETITDDIVLAVINKKKQNKIILNSLENQLLNSWLTKTLGNQTKTVFDEIRKLGVYIWDTVASKKYKTLSKAIDAAMDSTELFKNEKNRKRIFKTIFKKTDYYIKNNTIGAIVSTEIANRLIKDKNGQC